MIVKCAGCGTKYRVTEEKIGPHGVKVRCPKCRTVFEVRRQTEEEPETLAQKLFGKGVVTRAPGQPPQEPVSQAPPESGTPPTSEPAEVGGPAASAPKKAESAPERTPEAPPRVVTPPEPLAAPAGRAEELGKVAAPEHHAPGEPPQPPHEPAVREPAATEQAATVNQQSPFTAGEEDPRTLARALVSDILFYNRVNRDRGLAEGKLLAYLGKEIARSWETYRERVGLEKALEEDHFREAVNEILGEGKRVL